MAKVHHFVVLIFVVVFCEVNISSPVPEPQADQLLASAVESAVEAAEPLTAGNENAENKEQGKAEESSSENSSNGLVDMIPAPFKDKIPGMVSSSPESPTLFIGGFSVMMMPMPNGSDMMSFMQNAPSFMNFMQMVPTGK